jgi:hypothetical protein
VWIGFYTLVSLQPFHSAAQTVFGQFGADDFSLIELQLLAVKLHFLFELQINKNPCSSLGVLRLM